MAKKLPTQKLLHNIGVSVVKEAKDIAPVDTGELQASIDIIEENENEVIIGHKANPHLKTESGWFYPTFVHEGTKPYIIRPKKSKALANKAKGQFFGKEVHHPGIKAQPYLVDATIDVLHGKKLDVIADSFVEELGDELVKELKNSLKNLDIKVT